MPYTASLMTSCERECGGAEATPSTITSFSPNELIRGRCSLVGALESSSADTRCCCCCCCCCCDTRCCCCCCDTRCCCCCCCDTRCCCCCCLKVTLLSTVLVAVAIVVDELGNPRDLVESSLVTASIAPLPTPLVGVPMHISLLPTGVTTTAAAAVVVCALL